MRVERHWRVASDTNGWSSHKFHRAAGSLIQTNRGPPELFSVRLLGNIVCWWSVIFDSYTWPHSCQTYGYLYSRRPHSLQRYQNLPVRSWKFEVGFIFHTHAKLSWKQIKSKVGTCTLAQIIHSELSFLESLWLLIPFFIFTKLLIDRELMYFMYICVDRELMYNCPDFQLREHSKFNGAYRANTMWWSKYLFYQLFISLINKFRAPSFTWT